MNHFSTNLILLLSIATTTLLLNTSAAQVVPPVAQTESNDADPIADANFYLQKSETQIAELQAFVDSLRKKNNLAQFPFRPLMFSQRDVQQAFHTLGLARAQIQEVPDHIGVAKRLTHKRLTRQLQRLENYLQVARTGLQASLDPQAFPDLKADAARFRGLGIMLENLDSFKTDPILAAKIYRQLPTAQQEVDRLTAKYDLLIQQETIAGMQLAGLERFFDSKRKSFLAVAKQKQQSLPLQIKDSLTQIAKQLQQPAEQGSGASGLPADLHVQLCKTKADLELLETLDPQADLIIKPQRKQLFDFQVRLKNEKPLDNYAGDDRDDLVKTLVSSDVKPLPTNIRIPTKNWNRRTYWQYDGLRWREINRSILPFFCLGGRDGNRNSTWQAYSFTKDHLNDDAISVMRVPFEIQNRE